MTVFQANIRLSSDIFYFLERDDCGEVLLTTTKGVYLQFSSGIFMLTDQSFGITPIGLGVSRFVDFVKEVKPITGQGVTLQNGMFQFPGGILAARYEVIESTMNEGTPLPAQIIRCAKMLLEQCSQRSTARLCAPLLLDQQIEMMDPICGKALPILNGLLEGLITDNEKTISGAISKLLGLGHGLTPSMDDVLLGIVYGLQRFAPLKGCTASLRDAILRQAQSRTNAISAAYLEAVAQSGYFQRLDDAMIGLYNNIAIDISPLLEIGSSSGSEMLLGLLLAAKITTKG